jgi:hypothetical protein
MKDWPLFVEAIVFALLFTIWGIYRLKRGITRGSWGEVVTKEEQPSRFRFEVIGMFVMAAMMVLLAAAVVFKSYLPPGP